MKKNFLKMFISSSLIICLILSSPFINLKCIVYAQDPESQYNSEVVEFLDSALEQLLIHEINSAYHTNKTKITSDDLLKIYNLALDSDKMKNIKTLSDIKKIKNLRMLSIELSDDNREFDLSFLKDVDNLENLTLKNFHELDIKLLEEITKLNTLFISRCDSLKNIDSFKNLRNLENLGFFHRKYKFSAKIFTQIPRLKELIMWSAYINDINYISEIKNLKSLQFYSLDCVTDFSFLSKLDKLEKLHLVNLRIKNLDFIKNNNFKNLKELDLSHNYISDFSQLKNYKKIKLKAEGQSYRIKLTSNKFSITPVNENGEIIELTPIISTKEGWIDSSCIDSLGNYTYCINKNYAKKIETFQYRTGHHIYTFQDKENQFLSGYVILDVFINEEGTQTDLAGTDIDEINELNNELMNQNDKLNKKIQELEIKINSLDKEKRFLQDEINSIKEQKLGLEKKINELKKEIKENLGNIADQKEEINNLKEEIKKLNSKIIELEKKLIERKKSGMIIFPKEKIVYKEASKQIAILNKENTINTVNRLSFTEAIPTRGEIAKTIYESLEDNLKEEAERTKTYTDVNDKVTDTLTRLGIFKGYPDGSFSPDRIISRAEFMAVMDRCIRDPELLSGRKVFIDIKSGHWAKNEIEMLAGVGIITGYPDGTFKPENPITTKEMITILGRMVKHGVAKGEMDIQKTEKVVSK